MPLEDYGALLRSGAAAVPDFQAQQAQQQLLALKKQELGAQIEKQRQEQEERAKFDEDVQQVLIDPRPEKIAALMLKHPDRAEQIKSAHDLKEKAVRDADLTQMSEVYSAANAQNYKVAAETMRKRIAADKEAGRSDPADEAIAAALESGDPVQQKAALGMIGMHLAAATGAEHFGTVYGSLGGKPDVRNVDVGTDVISIDPATGESKVVYRNPYMKDATGAIIDRSSVDASLPGDLPAPQAAVASTLANALPSPVVAGFLGNFDAEGGYGGAKGDGGTAHGIGQWRGERAANFEKMIGKKPTEASPEEAAKFVLWEMEHPEAAGMTVAQRDAILNAKSAPQAAALIDQFYERSSGEHRQKRMAAAAKYAGGGAPRVLVPGKQPEPKDSFRLLTPAEKQTRGLDANTQYQINDKNGQVTALGGQQRQAKQIPQQVQSKAQPLVDVRDTLNRLTSSFKDGYGNHQILGGAVPWAEKKLGKLSGAPEGIGDWWADFQSMDNVVRNQLFGSALTEHEKRAYAATTVSPGMDSEQIKKNLNRRLQIIKAATARQQNFLKKNGYDPEAVDALFTPLGDFGGPSGNQRTIVRTGVQKSTGKRVVQYSDGTIEIQ